MDPKKQTEVLEEDDEFEEFENDSWPKEETKTNITQWEEDWDDEKIDDEFSKQLRAEIEKLKQTS